MSLIKKVLIGIATVTTFIALVKVTYMLCVNKQRRPPIQEEEKDEGVMV